jgi:hypothetical protein
MLSPSNQPGKVSFTRAEVLRMLELLTYGNYTPTSNGGGMTGHSKFSTVNPEVVLQRLEQELPRV